MAARIILLGILFTEVLRPVCPAGVRVNGSSRSSSKSEAGDARSAGGGGGGLALDIRPRGEIVLGHKGVTLSCNQPHHAAQQAEVSWLYNGEAAPPCGQERCNLLHNGSLRIHKRKNTIVQKRKGRSGNAALNDIDSGPRGNQTHEYRCVAHFSNGASLRSAPTNILYAELSHEFRESPEDLTVHEGEVSRFSCIIDSLPFPPNITWLRNGEIIKNDPNNTKYAFIPTGVLYIRDTKLSDFGSYRCVAANDYLNVTKKSKEAKLTVVSRLDSKEESHSSVRLFPQTTYGHSILNGSKLRLACAASGYPTPTTTWSFIPQHTDYTETVKQRALLISSSGLAVLELASVTGSDTGVYICSLKNLMNNSTEIQNITVKVLIPPSFISKPANQVCPNGRTARFECQAVGFPLPRIYWLKNAVNISNNGRKMAYDKDFNKVELAISATVPSDSGIYQCVAVNTAGEIWAAGRLQVNASRNSPAAPESLKCEAQSPVKILISWNRPRFLAVENITAYTVHYRPVEGGREEVSNPQGGNVTAVNITKDLEPFTNYIFYVRLYTTYGASDQSAIIICSTNASVPKTAPKISVNVISSTKLNVTWKPLTRKEAQGIVSEYKLEWRLFQHPSVRIRPVPADVEQYVLSDLIPGEKYDLRVLARTEEGWPNVTESQLEWVTVTMPSSNDLIKAQIFIVNSTKIKIKWNVRSDSIFLFTSWVVTSKTDKGIATNAVNLTKDSTEHIFTNLESDASYSIELCALNYEEIVHCITKQADLKKVLTSNAPTSLECVPSSSSSISLLWLSAGSSESNLFDVCYISVHSINESSTCSQVESTSIVINNLKPFQLYQFKVRVLSSNTNENPFSETVECYTKEDVPGKVQSIEWFLVNSTKVRVAWKEPNSINGVIQNYFITYSTDKSEPRSTWNNITVFGNKTFASLPGLVPGKRYFVVVQAATRAGFGNPSEPIIIVTGGSPSEAPSSLDEQKPLPKIKEDKKLGVILGISISIICILACLSCMYCRKKYENLRSLRESSQPLKNRVLTRNGNSCCVDNSSTSVGQPAAISNEIELAVLCPSTPTSANNRCDTKGGHANGTIESCAKEPLLAPWEINGIRNDLRITENPQYKPREGEESNKIQEQQPAEITDLENTQLTSVNSESGGSEESLNNKIDRRVTENDSNETLPDGING